MIVGGDKDGGGKSGISCFPSGGPHSVDVILCAFTQGQSLRASPASTLLSVPFEGDIDLCSRTPNAVNSYLGTWLPNLVSHQ